MSRVSFKVSRADQIEIAAIVDRAMQAGYVGPGSKARDRLSLSMDLTACHANGCPLRLSDLRGSSPLDFAHDVLGIVRHINRETGKLGDCFSPRYALRKAVRA